MSERKILFTVNQPTKTSIELTEKQWSRSEFLVDIVELVDEDEKEITLDRLDAFQLRGLEIWLKTEGKPYVEVKNPFRLPKENFLWNVVKLAKGFERGRFLSYVLFKDQMFTVDELIQQDESFIYRWLVDRVVVKDDTHFCIEQIAKMVSVGTLMRLDDMVSFLLMLISRMIDCLSYDGRLSVFQVTGKVDFESIAKANEKLFKL